METGKNSHFISRERAKIGVTPMGRLVWDGGDSGRKKDKPPWSKVAMRVRGLFLRAEKPLVMRHFIECWFVCGHHYPGVMYVPPRPQRIF